ncbi:OmpA family protein [Flavobacterium degerlachei]|jgi:outer membrane protein OmpA-like peptidoglycan-associated protein/tetratricopeptide (TPR) repeat protein|uniref:WD40-like Beta Propeller Repeat n=1 Tax=Flavobacterium degerlachei TaxID=229203 RepID=A0A1H3FKC9_9FLAO|nr:OmpA family protein [Flavobacterium degerlachei]SDX90569.1 WD40-like Beta Propeller Repeat [Flavobacterium degerlachei]
MKNYITLYLTIVSVFSFNCYSQKAQLASADKKYENYSYINAIKTYERVAEKGYKSADMFQKLGNAYYFNADLEQSAKWYGELFAMTSDVEPVYFYRYAQSLRAIGENDKANEMLKKFTKLSDDDSRGDLFIKNVNYLDAIKNNSGRYTVENAGINSQYSDYGAAITLNKIVFASARDTGSLGQRKHTWTNQHFTDLYVADLDGEMNPGTVDKFDRTVKSKFHEATPTFTKDGKTMYFTRNNYFEAEKGKNEKNITLIKIYKATLENDQWVNIMELPFDSDNYSTAHPALSSDDKTLYFASDMPGTLGQSDLFKVEINEDGTYGTPINLGETINTEGRETFPFINDENEVYFASDGHPGLGGLDIFVSKINEDGTFNKVQNVGSDVNSPKDDFAYWIDTKSRKGFFSSNRDGGQGYDDIYKFLELKKLTCEQLLFGKVTDQSTNEVLPGAKISLFDSRFNAMGEVLADSKGDYSFAVECGKTYNVRAEKTDYTKKEEKITIDKENGKTNLNIALEKEQCKVAVGDDLGKCFGIKMIYFDLDKSNIRKEAALDLEKILDVLSQNPTMKLDIRSHTDSRASHKYNEDLSDRRAKSTINWLIKNGVSPDRLIGKGYGETELVNKCSDGVDCTEDEHQMNRRSEFIITAL